MSTQNGDEDVAYNHHVLMAIEEFRKALEHLRDMILRISGLQNEDIRALSKKQIKFDERLDQFDQRQEQIRVIVFIVTGIIIGAVIALAVIVAMALRKA